MQPPSTFSPTDNLPEVIARAQAGDTLKLASGTYKTKLLIDKPITIEGPADRSAKIEGDRTGRTIAVTAPDVTLRNLTVTRSGMSLPAMDAGIYLEETAPPRPDRTQQHPRQLGRRVYPRLGGVYGARE